MLKTNPFEWGSNVWSCKVWRPFPARSRCSTAGTRWPPCPQLFPTIRVAPAAPSSGQASWSGRMWRMGSDDTWGSGSGEVFFFGGAFFGRVFIVFIVVMFEPSWEIFQTSQLLKDFDSCKLQDMRRARFATTFYVTKKQDASLPARSMPLASPCCWADLFFSSSVGDVTLTWGRRPGCLPDDWCQGVSWISKICVEIASMFFFWAHWWVVSQFQFLVECDRISLVLFPFWKSILVIPVLHMDMMD